MKKINKNITILIFTFFIILLLSITIVLANNSKNKSNIQINKEKIYSEIKYFDSQIIYMLNLLNNIEGSSNFNINWKKLEYSTKLIYNYWNAVVLDLNYLNIDKKYLTNFGKQLDELLLNVKKNNKDETIYSLLEIYNDLIVFSENINYKQYKYILLSKCNLLLAYSTVSTTNWTLAHEYILKSSEYIYEVVKYNQDNEYLQYNINQAYVSVKEMENLINIKDEQIFYIKYKIAIQKLENI